MAEKKAEPKIVVERMYNVPLRKGFQKAPKYRRAKKATNVLREFLAKHMKSDNIKLGKFLNMEVWKRGIKNPPHHVKVNVTKDSEGVVKAELVGAKTEKKAAAKAPVKKAEKPAKGIEEALEKLEKKQEDIKKDKAEEAKETEKKEIKELKKHPPAVPKEAKAIPKEKEIKHPSDIDAKTDKMPRGGQKLEGHQGEGKQKKKE
ncbi:MAG: 50S ribosomal protein L31e [Nanoarchaeota archaeon]|nr:50S ribosomal protein L31e [Nanoarchaeota archaeon]